MSTNDDVNPMSPYGDIVDLARGTGVDGLLMRAHCCRDWPVLLGVKIGRCGYCGEVPVVIGTW